jgi:hypothetical protein
MGGLVSKFAGAVNSWLGAYYDNKKQKKITSSLEDASVDITRLLDEINEIVRNSASIENGKIYTSEMVEHSNGAQIDIYSTYAGPDGSPLEEEKSKVSSYSVYILKGSPFPYRARTKKFGVPSVSEYVAHDLDGLLNGPLWGFKFSIYKSMENDLDVQTKSRIIEKFRPEPPANRVFSEFSGPPRN